MIREILKAVICDPTGELDRTRAALERTRLDLRNARAQLAKSDDECEDLRTDCAVAEAERDTLGEKFLKVKAERDAAIEARDDMARSLLQEREDVTRRLATAREAEVTLHNVQVELDKAYDSIRSRSAEITHLRNSVTGLGVMVNGARANLGLSPGEVVSGDLRDMIKEALRRKDETIASLRSTIDEARKALGIAPGESFVDGVRKAKRAADYWAGFGP